MKLTRLKILGFKTFVDPTDFLIEPGLTGVVGPNGCGKSNLVEALRWVMGENSYKSMRASGMDDVIFSGSGGRPSRNTAEVILSIDNDARRAPAAFNDTDLLEVSRKIEREAGSTYRINGKEVRARDIQLLFADAATGSRSHAMVRQGQIGEIIAAKPQARRRILEDAAGIAGLYSRRHEAELRLKAAEDNLLRLEDVLREIEQQAESLRRQAKQAQRYKAVSADLRRLEALALYLAHREAQEGVSAAERAQEADTRLVADRMTIQAAAAREQAVAASRMPALREAEAVAAAALQRLMLAREALDTEERRAKERMVDLERRSGELARDIERERQSVEDAAGTIARLVEEEAALRALSADDAARRAQAEAACTASTQQLALSEKAMAETQSLLADLSARQAAAGRAKVEAEARVQRLVGEAERVSREIAEIEARLGTDSDLSPLQEALEQAESVLRVNETRAEGLRSTLAAAREAEAAKRGPLAEAERRAQRLETEARTLAKVIAGSSGDLWPSIVEAIRVEKGYEVALGAALGDDLDASLEPSAPAHWQEIAPGSPDPALPDDVRSLSAVVEAPAAMRRRLNQVGIIERERGEHLRLLLKPGQRLVTREGDLWRWDGLTCAAEAPSPAAKRLAEKNRLADVERDAAQARSDAEVLRKDHDAAQADIRRIAQEETTALDAARSSRLALDGARQRLAAAEKRRSEVAARMSALAEADQRIARDRQEAEHQLSAAHAALSETAPSPELEARLNRERADVAENRAADTQARAGLQALLRETEMRASRLKSLADDRAAWAARQARAQSQIGEWQGRLAAIGAEKATLEEVPGQIILKRRALALEIEGAEAKRKEAADTLALAETGQGDSDRLAREALQALSEAREARARSEARLEAARDRLATLVRQIADALECQPSDLARLAGLELGSTLPDLEAVEAQLSTLKADRERLGAVNLRADEELTETEGKRDVLIGERDDLSEAIKRLRGAIQTLNKEGRERLLASFETVNTHFQTLFTTLFGGGTAELQLVEAEDPLESGLEIIAKPPGKKPQTMTLLSGGEQALTAIALIFAVFLTNPSPICVLDEVDAPLDDANVERYCDLLHDIVSRTDTRFVVITHNPVTMARMHRLFGVTMAERGVSQLVSVDLETAERVVAEAV